MKVTKTQKQVLVDLSQWLKKPTEHISLGGYAGTGKTTMIAVWRKILHKINPKLKVGFCAYTGKATRILAQELNTRKVKGKEDSVTTIHGLIYAPIADDTGGVVGWKRRSSLKVDLIIVDEASMVDKLIWHDLTSFGIPIVIVGDHGQLPPIGDGFNLMAKPDLILPDIHRQAADNPIIQLSMKVRELGNIEVGDYGGGVKKMDKYDSETRFQVNDILENWSDEWMVLVGYNHTRIKLNQEIRQMRHIEGESPKMGDRVICLKNNWEKKIYNGMTGTIERLIPEHKNSQLYWYDAEISLEGGDVFYQGKISSHQFHQERKVDELPGISRNEIGDLFDFGYALTVHKAQGSQSPKVLVFEERNKYMSDDDWSRWLYTAVTRAEKELVIVGS